MTNNDIVMQGSPSMENTFLIDQPITNKNYALKTAGFWIRFWAFYLMDSLLLL